MFELLFAAVLTANQIVLDNEYVRVTRDVAPCASASAPDCGQRVVVALDEIELVSGDLRRRLIRGDIAVFAPGESYEAPVAGGFFEVAIKSRHPPVLSPAEIIPADKNAMRYDSDTFFVFEERLAPGDTRPRHSHSQRVVLQLNAARLEQWLDGQAPIFVETIPDRPTFSPPVIHIVKNVGDTPLRGIVIEFKPESTASK